MEVSDNEILFIYNSKIFRDREALGYVVPLDKHKIKELDLLHDKLTRRQVKDIADRMDKDIEDLLDPTTDAYKNFIKDKSMDPHDLLTVIVENPDVLKTPIAVTKDKAVYVTDPYSLVNDDIEIEGVKKGYKSDT